MATNDFMNRYGLTGFGMGELPTMYPADYKAPEIPEIQAPVINLDNYTGWSSLQIPNALKYGILGTGLTGNPLTGAAAATAGQLFSSLDSMFGIKDRFNELISNYGLSPNDAIKSLVGMIQNYQQGYYGDALPMTAGNMVADNIPQSISAVNPIQNTGYQVQQNQFPFFQSQGLLENMANQSMPLFQQQTQNAMDILSGNFNAAESPLFGGIKQGIEEQYQTARDNLLSQLPSGGAIGSSLASLERGRAGSLSQALSDIYQQYLPAAQQMAVNLPVQAAGGLGTLAGLQTGAYNAAVAQQQFAQQQSENEKNKYENLILTALLGG